MPGTPVSDVIVLLGITGSVLQKDGKDVWATSGGAAVQAPRVIPDAHLIPGALEDRRLRHVKTSVTGLTSPPPDTVAR